MRVLHEERQKLGLVYFFGRQFRFTPAMRMARNLIAREQLGKIYFAEAVWVRSRGSRADSADGSQKSNVPVAAHLSTLACTRLTRPGSSWALHARFP